MSVLNEYGEFRIHSPWRRNFLATYQLFVVLSSLIGDTLILLASRNRDSFRLNKVLVTIMQHIAICDISVSIAHILPGAISLIADAWVLGDALCYLKAYLTLYFYPANMSLICVLIASKFLLLRKPLRARNWSRKRAQVICIVVWTFFFVYPILMFTLGKDDVSFDYRTYTCEYGYNSYTWKKIQSPMFMMSALVPNTVMIMTTVPTLKYFVKARKSAKRAKNNTPWQGALTIALTAIVYCLSTMPATVYYVGSSFVHEKNRGFNILYRYGIFLGMLNITSNFFIYALTIKTFRRYLLSKIEKMSTTISRKRMSRTGNFQNQV